MTNDPDEDLHTWFRGLREYDAAAAPPFESVLRAPARARRRSARWAWGAGGFALAAAGAFFLVLRLPSNTSDVAKVALPAWQSPTDFLLASADDSLQRLSWAPSPTFGLGKPALNNPRETR